jgi:AraC-like DNA-binding protein
MTEPAYRLIHPQANRSFIFKWEPFNLATRWHYHPEVELVYFVKGRTTGVIGDRFYQFNEGDLVLLGANFPHVLQEDKAYSREYPEEAPFGLIIQFTEDFLGTDILQKPEFIEIGNLLLKAHRGLLFKRAIVQSIEGLLLSMHDMSETRKLLSLLDVLTTLSEASGQHDFLTGKEYAYDHSQDEGRMRAINQYVYEYFTEKISISKIAGVANLTETSFCRYFKSRTLKSFTRFLNEVRVAYACKLLGRDSCQITDACFESGFTNLSYFNRQFKAIMKMSPRQYKSWKRKATAGL